MRITANQVTALRILLMPPVVWLLYGDETARLLGVIIGTFVGCTDFVDGYLARKQGPTVLGGLMDPIADKVFIAVAFLPYADLQWAPWWPIALLFLREFVVTAMRSSFERRQRALRSSYLAKVKTWVQMVGIGLLFLILVDVPAGVFEGIFAAGAIGALAGGVILKLVFKRRWRGSWVFAACFALGFVVFRLTTPTQFHWFLLGAIVTITWASGLDYLVIGVRVLLRDLHTWDAVRLAGAAAFPVLAILALVRTDAPAWAMIALVSVELAHGGLDNLLAHHGAAEPAWSWGGRMAIECGLLAAALAIPGYATPFAIIAFAVGVLGTIVAFVKNRRYYLEEKLREKKVAAPHPA